jgi:hypothetical protein
MRCAIVDVAHIFTTHSLQQGKLSDARAAAILGAEGAQSPGPKACCAMRYVTDPTTADLLWNYPSALNASFRPASGSGPRRRPADRVHYELWM